MSTNVGALGTGTNMGLCASKPSPPQVERWEVEEMRRDIRRITRRLGACTHALGVVMDEANTTLPIYILESMGLIRGAEEDNRGVGRR